jgi:hypothetical protein
VTAAVAVSAAEMKNTPHDVHRLLFQTPIIWAKRETHEQQFHLRYFSGVFELSENVVTISQSMMGDWQSSRAIT